MARRRTFSKVVTDSGDFLRLPLSSQCLYFHLGLHADDDGFIDNADVIRRAIGAAAEDIENLVQAGFIIRFSSGIAVITHWQAQNSIQKDRYIPTKHIKERDLLKCDRNKAYILD